MSSQERQGHPTGPEQDDHHPLLAGDARPDDGRTGRRRRRVLLVLGSGLIVALLFVAGAAWYLTERYAGNVDRIGDVFEDMPQAARPTPARPSSGGDPVTFLLVGSDSRAVTAEGELPGGRSDAIMIARVTGDRERAQVVSIPRDSWVEIPGRGMDKINASYAYGGPSLLIQTVEKLTGVRIDHFAVIDFDGLAEVTDALGGVEVTVAETTTNGDYTFEAGRNLITGEEARWYLGQRHGLPGGDFDRVKRQQQFIKAVMDQLISRDTFSDLGRLDASLRAVGNSVAVDSGLGNTEMLRMAHSMRNLTQQNIDFFTAPDNGTGMEGSASVVYLNEPVADRMWEYLRTDSLGENADEFADSALGGNPR